MPSIENLAVLIAILPGFLSQRIAHYIGTKYYMGDVNTIVTALLYSLFNFLIANPIHKLFFGEAAAEKISYSFILVILVVSILTGVGWSLVDRSDILCNIGITTKASQAHLWTHIFHKNLKMKIGNLLLKSPWMAVGNILAGPVIDPNNKSKTIFFLYPMLMYLTKTRNVKKSMAPGSCCSRRRLSILSSLIYQKTTNTPVSLKKGHLPHNHFTHGEVGRHHTI